jgi:hypothetical protein
LLPQLNIVPTIFPEQGGVHFLGDRGPNDGNGAEDRVVSKVEKPRRADDRTARQKRRRTQR